VIRKGRKAFLIMQEFLLKIVNRCGSNGKYIDSKLFPSFFQNKTLLLRKEKLKRYAYIRNDNNRVR
jgi:hypothetical protein